MILSMAGQAWLFVSTVLVGAAIGLFYDVFRILRKTTRHRGIVVQLEDLLFWVIATGLTFYYMLHRNYGEVRLFALAGVAVGILLYFATVSRWVVAVFVAVVNYMKRVVAVAVRVVLVPVRLAAAWLAPPLARANAAARKKANKARRYGRSKLRKTARSWNIVRKKV